MILSHGDLVAVADGANLKLYRNKAVEPEIDLEAVAHPRVVPANAGSGLRHHHEASNPDADRKAEDAFVSATADQLNRMALDGSLQRLVVIADPKTLGELRKHFHPALKAKIVGELAKELTSHSAQDVALAVRHA